MNWLAGDNISRKLSVYDLKYELSRAAFIHTEDDGSVTAHVNDFGFPVNFIMSDRVIEVSSALNIHIPMHFMHRLLISCGHEYKEMNMHDINMEFEA